VIESETNQDGARQFGKPFYKNIPNGINYKYLTEILADSHSEKTSLNLSNKTAPLKIIQRGCLNITVSILN